MSLQVRKLVTNIFFKRISALNYKRNEIRLIFTQYHTPNTSIKTQLTHFKCNKIIKREIAIVSRFKFAYENLTAELKNIYENGFKYLPLINASELKHIGTLWYASLDEVNVEEFFILLDMPDTFFSRYKVIELHIWMLLNVLPQETRKHKRIRYAIIQALWRDHEIRAKLVQAFNKNFRKNMRTLYKNFTISMLHYDIGYCENDMQLASSVWCNFFDKKDVDPRYIEVLVKFIRHQIHHLNSLNLEQLQSVENKRGIWLSVQPHIKEIFK